jgi:hypothetical protein
MYIKDLCAFWSRKQTPLDSLEQQIIESVAEKKMLFARVLLLFRKPTLCNDRVQRHTILMHALKKEESSEVIIYLIQYYNFKYEDVLKFLDKYHLSDEFKKEALARAKKYYEENHKALA